MSDPLIFEKNGHVVTLTINRPDSRNPLGEAEDADNFTNAAARINEDMDVRCVILTGAGSAFSAGGNIKAMRAIGLGNDVACMCDTRIASDKAKFGVTFLKIGLIPGDGGAWLLPKIIGMARAAELFYTGDVIEPQKAKEWGLVSEVVPHDDLMAHANALAQKICQQSPNVLRMTKRLMREGMMNSYDTVMEMSANMQALAHHTDDHMEALDAFFEKRPPVYKGQ